MKLNTTGNKLGASNTNIIKCVTRNAANNHLPYLLPFNIFLICPGNHHDYSPCIFISIYIQDKKMPQIGNTTSCYHRKYILSKHKGSLNKICQIVSHESSLNKF